MSRKRRRGSRVNPDRPTQYFEELNIPNKEEKFSKIWGDKDLTLSEKIALTRELDKELNEQNPDLDMCDVSISEGHVIDKSMTDVILKGWGCTQEDAKNEETSS